MHLAAISNDPVGHLNPDATYSVNAHGAEVMARAAKLAGVPRFLFSSSCSLYGAAGDAPVEEELAVQPGDSLRGEQGPGGERPFGAGRRLLQPDLPAQCDGIRLVAAPARRHRRQQPHGHRIHSRRGAGCSRTALPGGRSCTPPTSPGAFLAALHAPREVVHDQAFNVGRDEDVLQIRDIAMQVAEHMRAPVTFEDGSGTGHP